MIDREARKRMAELARGLALGRITIDEFEDSLPSFKNEEGLSEINYNGFWMLYDDLHEHKLTGKYALSSEAKKYVARIILFLRSDFEYHWPPTPISYFSLTPIIVLSLIAILFVINLEWLQEHFILLSLLVFPLFIPNKKGVKNDLIKTEKQSIKGDKSIWPFFSREDYEYALAHPVYLAGRNKEVLI